MVKASDNTQPLVDAVGLTKVFKHFWMRTQARAVDRVDFEIHPNEIFGLLDRDDQTALPLSNRRC